MAHEADAPYFAGHCAESSADFEAVVLEEFPADRGFVAAGPVGACIDQLPGAKIPRRTEHRLPSELASIATKTNRVSAIEKSARNLRAAKFGNCIGLESCATNALPESGGAELYER